MDSITLENYRCFRHRQTARLAPLTILVGENSTGKTSFLASVRALWDVAYGQRVPDFKEPPYDLGSFREIAHHAIETNTTAGTFMAGFGASGGDNQPDTPASSLTLETTFRMLGTRPVPIRRLYSYGANSIEEIYNHDHVDRIRIKTKRGCWQQRIVQQTRFVRFGSRLEFEDYLTPVFFYLHPSLYEEPSEDGGLQPAEGSPPFVETDAEDMRHLIDSYDLPPWYRPFASAQVRSKPHRTYDPSRPTWDPEGDYIPMYLAGLHSQDLSAWKELLSKLESFGIDSGLFNKIRIKQLGGSEGGPFQVEIGFPGSTERHLRHNLIDVGYGVSKVLSLVTELLREDAPKVLLLQQPEVHLHPSAQAALGSLFCEVVGDQRQIIVETHSDYILDRIRMDVRDGTTSLGADDVSILFFERGDRGVQIHSLRFDELGNVTDRPAGYRGFFASETRRSIGI